MPQSDRKQSVAVNVEVFLITLHYSQSPTLTANWAKKTDLVFHDGVKETHNQINVIISILFFWKNVKKYGLKGMWNDDVL